MKNTVFFGNGLNRISENSVSWNELLDEIKADDYFMCDNLPNTMVYERIFMEKNNAKASLKVDELKIKQSIAVAMKSQCSNELFELLANMDFDNYLTTNYDYAFEKAIDSTPEILSTEDIYSLRRKRAYKTNNGIKLLWNIHGEIDHPKSIMLGLDHYCGSVSKIDSYVKGNYKYKVKGETKAVLPMVKKLENELYCHTSWIDLFFSSHVHIIGFSLDYSETDIWWLLNKRARFSNDGLIKNKVYFYTDNIDDEKKGLLESFGVEVIMEQVQNSDYKGMYKTAIEHMLKMPKSELAA
ncbi:SIR2 family protein [Photobacterium sp. J15]|uniref:SIR2 family protein n=1 Tax=Photobacterium sp. J15 TaxID=265901 RepID=UPI0007E32A30|nr:SIR2 family protein [Photobacterium sp. J15]